MEENTLVRKIPYDLHSRHAEYSTLRSEVVQSIERTRIYKIIKYTDPNWAKKIAGNILYSIIFPRLESIHDSYSDLFYNSSRTITYTTEELKQKYDEIEVLQAELALLKAKVEELSKVVEHLRSYHKDNNNGE